MSAILTLFDGDTFSPAAPFTPATLFTGGKPGDYFRVGDAAIYETTAGAAVSADGVVGRIDGQVGNVSWRQTTTAAKPIYRTSDGDCVEWVSTDALEPSAVQTFNATDGVTIALRAKITLPGEGSFGFVISGTDGEAPVINYGVGQQWRIFPLNDGGAANGTTNVGGASVGVWKTVIIRAKNGAMQVWFDGATTGATAFTASGNSLGVILGSLSQVTQFKMSHFCILGDFISDVNRALLQEWLDT